MTSLRIASLMSSLWIAYLVLLSKIVIITNGALWHKYKKTDISPIVKQIKNFMLKP